MKKSLLFLILFLPLTGIAQQWTKVDAGSEFTLALKSDGTLWAWGFNGNGQLGLGTTTAQSSPTQIGTATDWQDVAAGAFHSLAVKADGTLWSWGLNGQGQLGLGTMTQETSPTQVGTATNWKSVEAGFIHSFAIKNDNSLWSWGLEHVWSIGSRFDVRYQHTGSGRYGHGLGYGYRWWRSLSSHKNEWNLMDLGIQRQWTARSRKYN
jgi:alpha-tubulin suppressor-like RCC1 family protein